MGDVQLIASLADEFSDETLARMYLVAHGKYEAATAERDRLCGLISRARRLVAHAVDVPRLELEAQQWLEDAARAVSRADETSNHAALPLTLGPGISRDIAASTVDWLEDSCASCDCTDECEDLA